MLILEKVHRMGSDIWWTVFGKQGLCKSEFSLLTSKQLKMGPGTAIVVTDATIVKDLMDSRSQSTADRPPNYTADLVTRGMNMGASRYSKYHTYSLKNLNFIPS